MFRSWYRCASACTLVFALVFLQSSRLEAQTLRILFTSVNGSTVTIQGENFASVTTITLGTVALENIVVSPAGDMITATLPVAMPNGSHLLTLTSSQSTSPVTCATASPAPDWVCVGDGWVPAGHPLAGRGNTDDNDHDDSVRGDDWKHRAAGSPGSSGGLSGEQGDRRLPRHERDAEATRSTHAAARRCPDSIHSVRSHRARGIDERRASRRHQRCCKHDENQRPENGADSQRIEGRDVVEHVA